MKRRDFLKEHASSTKEQLVAKRNELNEELFKLRCKRSVSQLEKPHLLRSLRRNIARVETFLKGK